MRCRAGPLRVNGNRAATTTHGYGRSHRSSTGATSTPTLISRALYFPREVFFFGLDLPVAAAFSAARLVFFAVIVSLLS